MKTVIAIRILGVFMLAFCVNAKGQTIKVEGKSPDLYIAYTVVPKDNFYSVGRQFNQAPKTIASFNSLAMDKGLRIGQQIKVPLTAQNYDAKSGQLKMPAANSGNAGSQPSASIPAPPVREEKAPQKAIAEPKADKPVAAANATRVIKDTLLIMKEEAPAEPAKTGGLSAQNETPVKEKPVAEAAPKEAPLRNEPATQPVIKEIIVKQPGVKQEPAKTYSQDKQERRTIDMSTGSVEGAFANVFTNEALNRSLSNIKGDAATFKSTSGWQDKKYYVLINDVPPGSVLKVSAGDKVVYAKVLGSMPEMKENTGLLLRLSNSAASYLGIVDSKFPVEVSYYK